MTTAAAVLTMGWLPGCASVQHYDPAKHAAEFRDPLPDKAPAHVEGLDDDDGPAVVRVPLRPGDFRPVLEDGGDWPDVQVTVGASGGNVDMSDMVALVLADVRARRPDLNLGMVVMDDAAGKALVHGVSHLEGSLRQVMTLLAASAGVQVTCDQNVVRVSLSASYLVPLPPFLDDKTTATIAAQVDQIVGTGGGTGGAVGKASVDLAGRTLHYRATAATAGQVARYIQSLRERPLLVDHVYVWDVILKNEDDWGINWQKLSKSVDGAANTLGAATVSGPAGLTNGLQLSSVVTTPGFGISVLANFLGSQGNVKTVLNQRIQMVAGGTGTYSDGGTQRIITGIGQQSVVGTSASSTGAAAVTLPISTEYEDIKYGNTVKLRGDILGSRIWTSVDFTQDVIQSLNPTVVSGVEINRPNISKRHIETPVESLPGEVIILGGTHQNNSSQSVSGPIASDSGVIPVPADSNKTGSLEETVIAIKTKVIYFVDEGAS